MAFLAPTENVVLSYISLYQILEFFYQTTADLVLHKRLQERLSQPNFSPSKAKDLRDIGALVRTFDRKMDEQHQLTSVLSNYFMPDEIQRWVEDYEREFGAH